MKVTRIVRRTRFELDLARARHAYPGVAAGVSPCDTMLKHNPRAYFDVGASALAAVRRSLDVAGHGPPASVLDFACGHGRVLRFLRSAWPDAAMVAADIDAEAADYCALAFGARALHSRDALDDLDAGGPFDLIWSGSLLTHLDAHRWPPALRFFERHLAPAGVLVYTTAGAVTAAVLSGDDDCARRLGLSSRYEVDPSSAARMTQDYHERGFGFAPCPNAVYGLSVSTRDWVEQQNHAAGLRMVRFEPAGWADHQDVVTCVKGA